MKKYVSVLVLLCFLRNTTFAAGKLGPKRTLPQKKVPVVEIQDNEKEVVPDIGDLTPSIDESPVNLQEILAKVNPVEPTPPTPTPADPLSFLKGAQGKADIGIFTGAVNFQYPLNIPAGRKGITPSLNLQYSSQDTAFNSPWGRGWSLSLGSVYRMPKKGVDKLYTEDSFAADINGQYLELVPVDLDDGLYGAKVEGAFLKVVFKENVWRVTDTQGTRYTFGSHDQTRQVNPGDASQVYKWMLERVEDLNGNFMTFSYASHEGQVYPQAIRYTGSASDEGVYEIRFSLRDRPEYTEYKRGFAVTTAKVIDTVGVYFKGEGVYEYNLHYDFKNNAVVHLVQIEKKTDTNTLPSTKFFYYTGAESEPYKKINLLKKIVLPYGGIEEFTYRPSTANRIGDVQANLFPFIIYTVYENTKKVSESSVGHVTRYEYEGGHYYYDSLDAYKKEYAGFYRTRVIDPEGHYMVYYFHQSEFSSDNRESVGIGEFDDHIDKKGKTFRKEVFDSEKKLQKVAIRKWERDRSPTGDRSLVVLGRETLIDYDGDASYRAKVREFTYDAYGNVIQEVDYGEVELVGNDGSFTDIKEDKRTVNTVYANNDQKYIHAFPSHQEMRDAGENIIGQEIFHYDDLSLGNVAKGNVTIHEKLIDKDVLAKTIVSYNTYGLPESITNPRGFTTYMKYDAWDLYPISTENALGHVTEFDYDYRFGVQNFVQDSNGAKTITEHDDVGRVRRVLVSNPLETEKEIVKQAYDYNFDQCPVSVLEAKYIGSQKLSLDTHTYFDGFARPIQVRTEAEIGFSMAHTEYDSRGNVLKEHLPVFSEGKEYTVPARTTYGTSYKYDAQNRPIEVTTPFGTTITKYDDWGTEITDPLGNKKALDYDANKNLIAVHEYLDGKKYTTQYEYNVLNQLVSLTDAAGNEKHFTYDFRGKKLSEEQLHPQRDTEFGITQREYDAQGNCIFQRQPNGNEIRWTYDALDRVVTEDFLNQSGIEIQYDYDQGKYGIGRLYSVQAEGTGDKYEYDVLGRVLHESRVIYGYQGDFETYFTYDLQGNVLSVTAPTKGGLNLKLEYTYNQAGKVEAVGYRDLKTGDHTSIIINIDYTPIGGISHMEFDNGVQTENIFDVSKMYYLTDKVTTKDDVTLQSLHYDFDAAGNILHIKDASDTPTAKNASFTYDDLYRLTSATITDTANQQDYTNMYTYDITGNMLSKSDVGTYVYGDVTPKTGFIHPHAVTSAGELYFRYDLNGNITSDRTQTYIWNYRNLLVYSQDGINKIEYYYDHSKKRVAKISSDGWGTFYVNRYFDLEKNNPKFYLSVEGLKVATVGLDSKSGIYTIYHHEDHLAGSNVDMNSDGKVNQVLDYFPYGEVRIDEQEGGFDNDYKFTGKEKDDETGLYYYGSRYYDSSIGRFTGIDPWAGELTDPQTLNKYAYVRNNPLKYIDPSGEKVELVAKRVALAGVHTFLRITPDNPQDFGANDSFTFTVGAYGVDSYTKLEARINSPSDTTKLSGILETREIKPSDKNVSDRQFIRNILGAYTRYDNNNMELYSPFATKNEYNCNTFTNTILQISGLEKGIPEDIASKYMRPGTNKLIPSMMKEETKSYNWESGSQRDAIEVDKKRKNKKSNSKK